MFSSIFSSGCTVDLIVDPPKTKKTCCISPHDKTKAFVFSDDEDISGKAIVNLSPARKLEHFGIRVELIGEIYDVKGASCAYSFFTMCKDLESPGSLYASQTYTWTFHGAEKIYETYRGEHICLRYWKILTKEVDIVVQNPLKSIPGPQNIKMEVGIEGCLHIELEYDNSFYHLKDIVSGMVHFHLIRIRIKYMEIDIIKTELVKCGSQLLTTTTTIGKFEIMDGSPAKLESIPLRLYLGGYDLTPTYINIHNRYSVKYYLNIVLVDEEDRRYFKRHDIVLYRKDDE